MVYIDSNKSFIELSDVYNTGDLFALLVKMLMINAVEKLNVTGLKNSSDYIESAVRNINSYSPYYFRRFSKYGKDVPIPFGNDECLEKFHNVIYDMEKSLEGKYYVSNFMVKFIFKKFINMFRLNTEKEKYIKFLEGNVFSSNLISYWKLIKDDKPADEELFNVIMTTVYKSRWNEFMKESDIFHKTYLIVSEKKTNSIKAMEYIIENMKRNRLKKNLTTLCNLLDELMNEKGLL